MILEKVPYEGIYAPTLSTAFTINSSVATSGVSSSIQKSGSIVCMYLDINATTSGTTLDVGTLADGYKTNRQFYLSGYDATDNKAVLVWFNTSGVVRIYNAVNGHEYVIFATYFSA